MSFEIWLNRTVESAFMTNNIISLIYLNIFAIICTEEVSYIYIKLKRQQL